MQRSITQDIEFNTPTAELFLPRPGFESCLPEGLFLGCLMSYQGLEKLVLQWLPFQAPSVTGSAPRLVDPVTACSDWVR